MQTLKFKILSVSNETFLNKKIENYSYAFRKLFSNKDKINNKEFIQNLRTSFDLDSYDILCLKGDVLLKEKHIQNQKDKNVSQQLKIENLLKIEKDKRKRFKLFKKLKSLEKSLSKNIVFGGKTLLQKLSFLNNDKEKNKSDIEKLRLEYSNNRIIPLNLGGEEHFKSNRKINFFFEDNYVIYKPNRNTKIKIEFICSRNYSKILEKLSKSISKLPISVKISKEFIYYIFDEEKLNGFGFDQKSCDKELKQNKNRKEVYRKFYIEQAERKMKDKLRYRYLSVDLNPEYIGWTIGDLKGEIIKLISSGCYDLSALNSKLKLSSTEPKQVYQNNKRKHEIKEVWKDLFKKAIHFKVGNFVFEELNFKNNILNEKDKEANRKTKNIWHRSLTTNLITKYCNTLGLNKIEVNPAYTSFIGNIQYNLFDPTNSSLEICRRGIFKFKKNSFYPKVNKIDLNTMSNLIKNQVRDVSNKNLLIDKLHSLGNNWVEIYRFFRDTGLKYRRTLEDSKPFKVFSLNNTKSKISLYSF